MRSHLACNLFQGPCLSLIFAKYELDIILLQILPTLQPVLLGLTQMALTASVFTTLAVAVERFISVKR